MIDILLFMRDQVNLKKGIVVGTLDKWSRCIALVTNPELLPAFESQEMVGKTCMVQYDSSVERNTIISIQ